MARAARAIVIGVVALAVGAGGIVAAAATTTSTSTTSTTTAPVSPTTTLPTVPTTVAILPPPPPFPLGDDFGRLTRMHRAEAYAALATANADVATATRQVALTSDHVNVAEHAQAQARAQVRVVARRLAKIHTQIKALAVEAYMFGSSVQITGTLSSFASARDVIDLSRNLTLVHSSHDRMNQLVGFVRHEQSRAAARVRVTTKAVAVALDRWNAATTALAGAQQRRTDAQAAIDQAARDDERFLADATTSASPIMGPSRLTADDLVAYIDSLKLDPQPKLTVPIRTLAGYYISEGNAEGIRGDVAFAQSILETGAFTFPGHGLLDPVDNNFAGINACDSCKHGDKFESALLGVRAQIQLLRVYADPTLEKITDFADPIALLHNYRLGATGFAKTWYSLGGRWATGPNYGFHIYDIYLQMVALSERRR